MQKRNEIVLKDYISKYNLLQSEKNVRKNFAVCEIVTTFAASNNLT